MDHSFHRILYRSVFCHSLPLAETKKTTRKKAGAYSALISLVLLLTMAGCAGKSAPVAESASPAHSMTMSGEEAAPPFSSSSGVSTADPVLDSSGNAAEEFSLDDYDDDEQPLFADPWEPWNRFWFRFNDTLLMKVFKPVHTGYTKVVPSSIRSGLSNFHHNLGAPVRFLNSLLQGKLTQAGVEFGRFFINTVTSLGLADVASQNPPLFAYHPETANLGCTLGVWGFPQGPYVVWPFWGPSTVRGTFGRIGDNFMNPQNYVMPVAASVGTTAGLTFNELDATYVPYGQMTDMSLEPYIAIRNAYLTLLNRQPH